MAQRNKETVRQRNTKTEGQREVGNRSREGQKDIGIQEIEG